MRIVILDAETLGEDLDLSSLCALGQTVVYGRTEPSEVASRLADADIAVFNKIRLGRENLSGARHLRLLCVAATGYDNIDTAYCRENGIALCNVPGYSTDSVVQLTFAMAFSLLTHLEHYRQYVDSGAYTASGAANCVNPPYHELSSMTFGVVGGGAIGSRVAEIARTVGCRVLMCRRQRETRFEEADLDTLCRESDVISLHVPLQDSTKGMIDRRRIGLMKPSALFLNLSRGAVTDEEALAQAIESGRLGGLGADVYTTEPFPETHPFFRLLGRENVCLTPHMAWGSVESRIRCVREIAENIKAFALGEPKNRIV